MLFHGSTISVLISDPSNTLSRISGKVLSDQLKNLERCGYIEKVVVCKTPLKAEYQLTEQGRGLNRALYELMVFTRNYIVSEDEHEFLKEENLKKYFGV